MLKKVSGHLPLCGAFSFMFSKKMRAEGAISDQTLLKAEFKRVLKTNQVDDDVEERKIRAKPWNSYHKIDKKSMPSLILFPESTRDVSEIMKLCSKFSVPVVPFGGGTSLEGQTLPIGSAEGTLPVSIDFSVISNYNLNLMT